MFWDQATITVRGGDGGRGITSFRRERCVAKGGPDGGDGGHGGDVYLVADTSVTALVKLAGQSLYSAEDGRRGGPRNQTGKSGQSLCLKVPVGTIVRDPRHGNVLKDLDRPGAELCVARGGRGGRGNSHFATATRRVPKICEPGTPGERRTILLDLKLIADVGLVGLPNAGKSTLVSRISDAHPKVADYPFTTLEPVLGVVSVSLDRTLVFADLPGLIEGAHEGHGLGDRFLRHVERTRVLLHLVDCMSEDSDPVDAVHVIEEELASYSADLGRKPRLVVASKVESEEAEARARALEEELGERVLRISAATGKGLAELIFEAARLVDRELLGTTNDSA